MIVILSRLGRSAADKDPFLDPMANPNIRVQAGNWMCKKQSWLFVYCESHRSKFKHHVSQSVLQRTKINNIHRILESMVKTKIGIVMPAACISWLQNMWDPKPGMAVPSIAQLIYEKWLSSGSLQREPHKRNSNAWYLFSSCRFNMMPKMYQATFIYLSCTEKWLTDFSHLQSL